MPKGKKQPVPPDQLKLIELWIGAGASGALPQDAIKNLPAGGSVAAAPIQVSFPEIDRVAVAKAREKIAAAIAQLQDKFPNILDYESRGSADLVLNASLLGTKFGDADLQAFAPVADHITVADLLVGHGCAAFLDEDHGQDNQSPQCLQSASVAKCLRHRGDGGCAPIIRETS